MQTLSRLLRRIRWFSSAQARRATFLAAFFAFGGYRCCAAQCIDYEDYAFVAGNGLTVVDVSNPATPLVVASLNPPGDACDLLLLGDLAYVAGGYAGLHIVDISEPERPLLIDSVYTVGPAWGLQRFGDIAYVIIDPCGLRVFDISVPLSPRLLGSNDTLVSARSVAVAAECAYIADQAAGLVALPAQCEVVTTVSGAQSPLVLLQVYPNPLNPQARLRFAMREPGFAILAIYDPAGRLVARLAEGHFDAGTHERGWNGCDGHGRAVGSGIYLARLETRVGAAARKLVLLR